MARINALDNAEDKLDDILADLDVAAEKIAAADRTFGKGSWESVRAAKAWQDLEDRRKKQLRAVLDIKNRM